MAGVKCGGHSDMKNADEDVQAICDEVKSATESVAGVSFERFVAVGYKTQVVAGTNYLIKVDVGNDSYVHLKVFKSLPHAGSKLEMKTVEAGKLLNDELNP